MKNKILLVMLAIALVLGMTLAGCKEKQDDPLNGTWENAGAGQQIKLDNGSCEMIMSGTSMVKGTYTASGSNITFKITEMWGPFMNSMGGSGFTSKWYTKAELITSGMTDDDLTFTGTYTDTTLTIPGWGDAYTKK